VEGDDYAVADCDNGYGDGDEGHAPVEAVGEDGEADCGDGAGDVGWDGH